MSTRSIHDKLIDHGINKDCITSLPPHDSANELQQLDVVYANTKHVTPGLTLTPTEVRDAPTSYKWQAEPNSLYTVILLDPDAPSSKRPLMRNIVHQLTVNIKGGDINTGDKAAPYSGAGPPQGSGYHRYVFVVYKQTSRVDPKKLPGFSFMQRGGYAPGKIEQTLQKAGSGELKLVAANWFQAQYDDYVPTYYFEQLGYFAYPVGIVMKLLVW